MSVEDVLKDIMTKLGNHESRIFALEGMPVKKPQAEGKKLSLREFLFAKKSRNGEQKTLAIGN